MGGLRGETVMEGTEERVEKPVRWDSEDEWRVFGGDKEVTDKEM